MDGNADTRPADRERDAALMRRLAGDWTPYRRARLRLGRGAAAGVARRLDAARRLRRAATAEDEALARLDANARAIEACARRASRDGGARLPSWRGRPRIEVALGALCAGGEERLTRRRLLGALEALDAVQELTQDELWAVPSALEIVLARAFARVLDAALDKARSCAAAERWVAAAGRITARPDPAFVERALRRAGEDALPEARSALEALLARRGLSARAVVAKAQSERAGELLRLDNLLSALRMLEALDWRRCFEALSSVERELRGDASGVYPRMDDESRAAVRAQVTRVARRLGQSEATVARSAASASDEARGVCWQLFDDDGLRALAARMGHGGARLEARVPDPSGRRTVAALLAMSAALALLLAGWVKSPWLVPACAILGWTTAGALAGRFFSRRFRPARLLKLEMKEVPEDCRTLVTMPVLLSSAERAEDVCAQLEALGCLEPDENIEYLLLGDLADAGRARMPSDAAILARARACVDALNARAGRRRYALLCRGRALLEADGVWMGRDRKRGALTDLNRLLLAEDGAEDAFGADGADCARLKGRFRFVLTLDADTRLLPEDVRRLIGAMAHPLNRPDGERGYAVLQPRVEPRPSACVNGFMKLFAGAGGLSAYPVAVSNLWQDLTGRGIYAGKGIYDVRAFHARLDGALPEGRVLSHDLIEGAIAGAGFVGDVALYDAGPATLSSSLMRLHRWTRGDWQLLGLLCRRGPLPNGRRLSAASRFQMADNLVRSLRAPALLAMLLAGAWTGGGALPVALALSFLPALLGAGSGDALRWRRAVAELATLPAQAWCALDAAGRTLWRLGVSGKRLMQWVTAADAEARDGGACRPCVRVPCRAAALLAVPGLLVPGGGGAALALGLLFLVAPGWIRDMERQPVAETAALSGADRAALMDLARETWRFFEDSVPVDGNGLPPDNVQLDPPVGAARRTSPTNVALYLLGCLSAARLGFVGVTGMRARMAAAVSSLEEMEKWRGNPYNWVDIDSLEPLRPRYVSSVDCGNLAAALLLCAGAAETGGALAGRMRALAEGMDLAALYDPERELFAIGVDAESGRMSASRYDLLASESRLLSFAAMMLGVVPARHWRRLGRACAAVGGGVAPLSWSGTMFEYLMPELFMTSPAGTLLGDGVRAAVRAQKAEGRRTKRPWGVSESGYCALDAALNYQYRAFGLRDLALDGSAAADVVAPYAAALAVMVEPHAAAENLADMIARGWSGEWGLYEAADYRHPDAQGRPAVVKSHMAHHQGMALCALCNALTGDSLRRDFMALPEARALSLLLEERACEAAPARRRLPADGAAMVPRRAARRADPNAPAPRTHLMHGGGARALCTDDGAVHYMRGDVCATRFDGALQGRGDAARVYLYDAQSGAGAALGLPASSAAFEPGAARWSLRLGALEAELTACVSPEDGTLLRVVSLRNAGQATLRCAVTDVVPVALATEADWRAHAAFQSLFVESERLDEGALCHRRRKGSPGAAGGARLVHVAAGPGEVSAEANGDRVLGRMTDAGWAALSDAPLSGGVGAALNPVSALRAVLALAPGESAHVRFALCLADGEAAVESWLERWRRDGAAERAERLAAARAGEMLGFLGLDASRHDAAQRMAALLVDGALASGARGPRRGEGPAPREWLWPLGISGDRPLLAMSVRNADEAPRARELIRAHAFYRSMGLEADLALVDDGGAGYARPVRDALENLIASGHLNGLRGVAGGAWLLDGEKLTEQARVALRRHASAYFTSDGDFWDQARALMSLPARGKPYGRMDVGASTLAAQPRLLDNGFGGFVPGGYAIDVGPGQMPPAAWRNVAAGEHGGLMLSERGGAFFWHGNSRECRLTPWRGDALREDWGLMLYLADDERGEMLALLPGEDPHARFRAVHGAQGSDYSFEARRAAGEVRVRTCADGEAALIDVALENRMLRRERLRVCAFADWLMGADARDRAALNCWCEDGACLATGASAGVGWLAALDAPARGGPGRAAFLGRGGIMAPEGLALPHDGGGWTLSVPLKLSRGERRTLRFCLGWSEDVGSARAAIRALRAEPPLPAPEPPVLVFETPDEGLNALANDFLFRQALDARVRGRVGPCQPGGAWGFRDQLQDMLALIHIDPVRVRAHLLRCAARQFEAGDVLHWWHEPFRGVRTRVSDDMLFLPYVAAAYVKHTGDAGVLAERVPYLKDVPIPEGRTDVYGDMRPGEASDTLHGHCMRAFRRASRTGAHGLLLMGGGDWNDGMNRVGAAGRGESVWLSEFAIACANAYRAIAPVEADRVWLWRLAEQLRGAVEARGWDGGWYLRAWDDSGAPLGGRACGECRIDAIAQAWAELAGLDDARCRAALDAAWERLVDEGAGIVRLLTPPFDGRGNDPGYIAAYPPGVRENGGQYTHGALWLLLALIHAGDAERAHRMLRMLLPCYRADTREKALVYRAEPYVMAADVYDAPGRRGQAGWTWYTGAAGWMLNCLLALLGYERRGDRVRLNALLGDWPSAALTVSFGRSRYRLVCDRKAVCPTLDGEPVSGEFVVMTDDGREHEARFPAR